MGVSRQYQRGKTTGAKAQNVEFFASDIFSSVEDGMATKIRVTMAFSVTPPIVEVTFNSGTDWFQLNSGAAIPVGQLFSFDLPGVDNTDLINFRTPTAGGTTLKYFRVDSLPVGD